MDKSEIKEEVIKYLFSKGCALKSQITKFLGLEDARYLTVPLNELLEEKIVLKIIYKRFKFYVLTRNELEIKRKISSIKQYIMECIQHFGPIKARILSKKINENYEFDVSHRIIYRMAQELLLENKIEAKKVVHGNIYYEKGNQNQELIALSLTKTYELKKKTKNLKGLCERFTNDIIENNILLEEDITILQSLFPKIKAILYDVDCKGRNLNKLIHVVYTLQLKKEIFFGLKKEKYNYDEFKPFLNLYEIITRFYLKITKNISFKTYKYFVDSILNDKRFCNQKDRNVILNAPSYLLRMEYLLKNFNLNENINQKILKFIERLNKIGYNIAGKDIKGVLAGIIYFFSRTEHFRITQKELSEQLGVSEVTIRSRHRELKSLYYEKTPKKSKQKTGKVEQNYPKSYRETKITDFINNNNRERLK